MKYLNRSGVNYLTHTWNPIKEADGGFLCTKVSPGCLNCWAGQQRKRFRHEDYSYTSKGLNLVLDEEMLTAPLRLPEPSIIGVQFMSDLFHEDVKDNDIEKVLSLATGARWHTFLFLTKRPDRAKSFGPMFNEENHLWLGVSVENQETADQRIPALLSIPAAKRWVSVEPMLEPVLFEQNWSSWLTGWDTSAERDEDGDPYPVQVQTPSLNWVVCGCESGRGRRPMDIDWVRSLRDQCVAARVPFWFKQAYENGKLVQLPLLDGKQWKQRPPSGGKEE